MNEIMSAINLMRLITEDFNLDEETMRINQVLLNEDESPINIINTLDQDKETEKESDKKSDEIEDLLGIDDLIDRMEDDNENNDNIDLTLKDSDNLKINLSNDTKKDDSDLKTINVNINEIDKLMGRDDLQVNINNKNNNDNNSVNVNINNNIKSDNEITLKLKNKNTPNNNNDDVITLKLKDKDDFIDKNADVKINLTNTDNKSEETKTSLFIRKRDELIQSDDENMQLSVCLKIIVDLKKSLDRLINFVPDEVVLVRTKYLLSDILDEILESSNLILKNKEKLKDIIYKTFDLVISVNEYIEKKYIQLEDKLDKQSKDSEDDQISKQLNDTNNDNENDNKLNNLDNNNDLLSIKRPNINRKKF